MAAPLNLREWIARLERLGELTRVGAEVDPDLEITEIADRAVKAGGPALLFERPKGSEHPLLINQFGTEKRMCLALGVESLDEAAARVASLVELKPPQGARAKLSKLRELKSAARNSQPRRVRRGACQEIVLTGEEIDLGLLPVQRCWPDDPAPFITLPAVITHDPRTGARNVGMYRMQLIDRANDLHALAAAQGRRRQLARDGRPARAGGRDRARSSDHLRRHGAAAARPRRADAGRAAARRAGRAGEGEDRSDRRAGRRRDRARGLHRARRDRDRGAVRRSHRLLLPRRVLPALPPHRDDDALRRDLSVDRRR